ncbi:MAG: PDZ domain-containing protein [Pseudomonadota bacterium]
MSESETDGAGLALMANLRYHVAASNPASHEFEVQLRIPARSVTGALVIRLPAWIPGSYMVRDYARHVVRVSAKSESTELAVERYDKSSWRIAGPDAGDSGDADIVVDLLVYAWDLSVRGAHLDLHHAYFNGACLFPEVVGYTGDIELEIAPMPELPDEAWVGTSMRPVAVDERGFGRYVCSDYDELLDHPVEIAVQTNISFSAAGVPHRLMIRGGGDFDEARLARDCERIFATHHELLGTPTDLDRYDVLAFAEVDTYGGLEHRWSTSLAIGIDDLPRAGAAHNPSAYRKLLGLISHEYFHLWNVRRLKPAAFSPLDLSREVHTSLLWVFEGVTSYYDDLALVRSGVIEPKEYLNLLAQNLTRVWRTSGRHHQTLADSSFDAWTKFYKQDENATNAIVSYYAKGAAIALALDLTLRTRTTTTLDEVMRVCWQRFYVDGHGMPEAGLETVVAELTGGALQGWFDRFIRGYEDPDFETLFNAVGIRWVLRPATGPADAGGMSTSNPVPGYLGFRVASGQTRVAAVMTDGPAQRAGLSAGDEIVSVDGLKADPARVARMFTQSEPGQTVELHVFRRSRLLRLMLTVAAAKLDTVVLAERDDVSDAAVTQRRALWLAAPIDA